MGAELSWPYLDKMYLLKTKSSALKYNNSYKILKHECKNYVFT